MNCESCEEAEELADRGRHRLRVDEVVRHEVLALGLRQTLFHRALDAHQTGAELVLRELAHRTHAAIAEVVDVVDLTLAVTQIDEDTDHRDDVVGRERAGDLRALRGRRGG
jgi:hypothetical protein